MPTPIQNKWTTKDISLAGILDLNISLSNLERLILSLPAKDQAALITEVLANGGPVLDMVREWVNEPD